VPATAGSPLPLDGGRRVSACRPSATPHPALPTHRWFAAAEHDDHGRHEHRGHHGRTPYAGLSPGRRRAHAQGSSDPPPRSVHVAWTPRTAHLHQRSRCASALPTPAIQSACPRRGPSSDDREGAGHRHVAARPWADPTAKMTNTPGTHPGVFVVRKSGGDLLSQGVSPQVPSAQAGLTAVFGMGTGVTPPPWPPETCCQSRAAPRGLQSEHEPCSSKPSAD
jgi:hypothetical protein